MIIKIRHIISDIQIFLVDNNSTEYALIGHRILLHPFSNSHIILQNNQLEMNLLAN
jgi:hypothetical protein